MDEIVEIIDSWNIAALGMIAEVKYRGAGLPTGTMLRSGQTGRRWVVKSRVFFNHSSEFQRKFGNETASLLHLSFISIDDMEKSRASILDKEKDCIYQYGIVADGHKEPPSIGDLLEIEGN